MASLSGLLDAMSAAWAAPVWPRASTLRVWQQRARRTKSSGRCDQPPRARRRAHRARLTAWVGLLAMWLAIVAPVVTQLLPTQPVAPASAPADVRAQLRAALCSAHNAALPLEARASPLYEPARDSVLGPHSPSHDDHHAKACGYCNLLAHSPPIGGAVFVAVVSLVASQRVLALRVRHVLPLPRFALATPRGPPQTVA